MFTTNKRRDEHNRKKREHAAVYHVYDTLRLETANRHASSVNVNIAQKLHVKHIVAKCVHRIAKSPVLECHSLLPYAKVVFIRIVLQESLRALLTILLNIQRNIFLQEGPFRPGAHHNTAPPYESITSSHHLITPQHVQKNRLLMPKLHFSDPTHQHDTTSQLSLQCQVTSVYFRPAATRHSDTKVRASFYECARTCTLGK